MRALIVDCDPQTRRALTDSLAPEGFECIEARDGVEAVQQASEHGIDLIITDLETPRIGGLELIDLMAKGVFGARAPPVIICVTDVDYEAFVLQPELDAAVAVIHKPVQASEFRKALAKIFEDQDPPALAGE